jgi:hypothetical protein
MYKKYPNTDNQELKLQFPLHVFTRQKYQNWIKVRSANTFYYLTENNLSDTMKNKNP